jgi:tripartite-type tricarboxylate transporter receptor subunit TctC
MFFDTLATSVPMYRADKVKILAVGSPERSRVIPEVPTMEEQGLPGFRSVTWFAVVAPPQTPEALAEKINHDIVDVLRQADVAAKLDKLSLEPLIGSRADAANFFAEEAKLWGKVIAAANIKLE